MAAPVMTLPSGSRRDREKREPERLGPPRAFGDDEADDDFDAAEIETRRWSGIRRPLRTSALALKFPDDDPGGGGGMAAVCACRRESERERRSGFLLLFPSSK